ncbi:hypothetical protein PR048_015328 [Dryococelus australis]|uniref:DUF4371 domain-containing protein n=1 Tax=Dryococelus australis TaxID=614101 RepID=A0ABQ9HGM8_9NEOP|nr:hypothetical protein PR048_015328 [Dryococelus australis]
MKLRFPYKLLEEFDWLSYSENYQGASCKYCVVTGGIGNQALGQLVKSNFNNWKRPRKFSGSVLTGLLNFVKYRSQSIINKIDKNRAEQIYKNRKYLEPITECIILCGRQEISLCGHRDSSKIYDFLQFFETNSLKGQDLTVIILNGLIQCGLNCEHPSGQGYDGAGIYNGVQSIIKKTYPEAIYVHCAAHFLNLAITKSSEIQAARNCLENVEKFYDFLNTPKRKAVLSKVFENSVASPSARSLKGLFAMRWTATYDAVYDFNELLEYTFEALKEICRWYDPT